MDLTATSDTIASTMAAAEGAVCSVTYILSDTRHLNLVAGIVLALGTSTTWRTDSPEQLQLGAGEFVTKATCTLLMIVNPH